MLVNGAPYDANATAILLPPFNCLQSGVGIWNNHYRMNQREAVRLPERINICFSGFTLVELLVVISIIALLIAILLPVLRAAKEEALAATCLSNQRQVGIALQLYADANDSYFPKALEPSTVTEWSRKLCEEGLLPKHSDALYCPMVTPQRGDSTLPYEGYRNTFAMPTYRNALPAAEFITNLVGTGNIVRSHIKRPSEVYLSVDSWSVNENLQVYYVDDFSTMDRAIHLRHGNEGANASKADGSARREDESFFRKFDPYVWSLHSDGTFTTF